MKEKFNQILNTKKKQYVVMYLIILAIAAGIYSLLPNPKIESAYTRVATLSCNNVEQLQSCETGLSKEVNCLSQCKSYKMLEKINIEKTESEHFKVFDKNGKYTYIAAGDVIFENTPEFQQAKIEKENYQQNSEKVKTQLVNKRLAELDPKIKKVFVSTNIRPELYYCYIKPSIWNALSMPEKQQAFTLCAEYGKLKNSNPYEDATTMQLKTLIKDTATEKNLAEYNVMKGIITHE